MPRTLKSYAGFFCPMSPVSSLLTDNNNTDDHYFYTRDNLTSVFKRYHRNKFDTNFMCAWELVFGKHYHGVDETFSDKTSFAKGALDYLIFPLIARGLGDCNCMLYLLIKDNILPTIVSFYIIIVITAVIIALELIRLVLGIPLVLPAWGVISAMRTFNSKAAENDSLDRDEETSPIIFDLYSNGTQIDDAEIEAWRLKWK